MSKHFKTIEVRYDALNIFPAVVDYDFEKNMPRNGSVLFDFFSLGRFSNLLSNVDMTKPIYISLKGMLLARGVYLLDFKKLQKNGLKELKNMLKDLDFKELYLDSSEYVEPAKVADIFPDKDIILINFAHNN